jgi:hypothetical protein
MALPICPQRLFTIEKRAASRSVDRYGDVPLGAVIQTDERYNTNVVPGSARLGLLEPAAGPQTLSGPEPLARQTGDVSFGQMALPAGTSPTIHSRFPYARYFKFNFYKFEHNTFEVISGASLAGYDNEADPSSGNLYVVGAGPFG